MDLTPAEQLRAALRQARRSLKAGDNATARDFARQAARLNPENEEAWLILASVSTPRQAIAYFNKVLKINPTSQPARKGLHLAARQAHQQALQSEKKAEPSRPEPPSTSTAKAATAAQPARTEQKKKSKVQRQHPWPVFLFLALVTLGLTLVFGFGPTTIVVTFDSPPAAQPPVATLPPPASTPTPIPAASSTPVPSMTAIPTYTLIPTFVPAENKAYASYYAHSWDITAPAAASDDFWLEIDLSQQMLFAYEGSTLLNSFLVSTGTSQHPTVTGSYKIYAMHPTYTMRGPGYDLPDVPYSMFFYKGYSIHGTYWHNNFGTTMSHGCVNMETSAAAWVYERARIGTPVIVHY